MGEIINNAEVVHCYFSSTWEYFIVPIHNSYVFSLLSSLKTPKEITRNNIVPIFHMRKLRFKKVKHLGRYQPSE